MKPANVTPPLSSTLDILKPTLNSTLTVEEENMRCLFLAIAILLSGCETIPLYSQNSAWSPKNTGYGSVRVRLFRIPKDEPGVTLFYLAGALAGANVNNNFNASIYDVTDDIKYVGTLNQYRSAWLEYSAPIGRRLLMLVSGNSELSTDPYSVSFLEVNVSEIKNTYVAVSLKGLLKQPYLGEITIKPEDAEFCSSLDGTERKEQKYKIDEYMRQKGIDIYANDFKGFCNHLSSQKLVYVPNNTSVENFNLVKDKIYSIKERSMEKWRNDKEEYVSYDLMRLYKPQPKRDEW